MNWKHGINLLLAVAALSLPAVAFAADNEPAVSAVEATAENEAVPDPDDASVRRCFPGIEVAARTLRYGVDALAVAAARAEYRSHLEFVARNTARSVGTFQYQVFRTCDADRVYELREQLRDALDNVRQVFRGSELSTDPYVFAHYRAMVTQWEILRDLVSDLEIDVR